MEVKTLFRNQSNFPISSQVWFKEVDYLGKIEIINQPMMAVFSSAQCPASLILKAHDYAREIRDGSLGLISGFHSPAEQEVLEVALKGTCPIIVALGRRLENARIPTSWKEEVEKGKMLIISPFKEYQAYVTKEMSMQRNDLAAHIAGRVLIVHASEGGRLQSQTKRWKEEKMTVKFLFETETT